MSLHRPLPTVTLSLALGLVLGLALAWAFAGRGELRYSDLPVVEAPLPPPAAEAERRVGSSRATSPGAACGGSHLSGPSGGSPETRDRLPCDGAHADARPVAGEASA